MDLNSWLNIGILLAGFAGVLVPLHLDNRRKTAAQAERQMRQGQVLNEVLRTLKRHDKRTRKARQIAGQVLQRMDRIEMAIDLNSYTRNPPP